MKRFIIAADGLSKDTEKKIIEFFKEHKLAWWHRMANVWLVSSQSDEVSVAFLRDKIGEIRPTGIPFIIVEVGEKSTWAGMKPRSKPEMFDWLKKAWALR